jgi:phage-related protein
MHHYLMSEDDQKKPLLDFLSDRTAITNMLLRTPTSDGKFRIACMNKVRNA